MGWGGMSEARFKQMAARFVCLTLQYHYARVWRGRLEATLLMLGLGEGEAKSYNLG